MKKSTLFFALVLSIATNAQTKPEKTAAAKPTTKPATTQTLPSQETVNEFLRHTFGYDQNLKWRIVDIKPAADPTMAEVNAVMSTPDGQQTLRLFVTPNQNYVISGDFVPFAADPYAAAREKLKTAANGPSRGPADAPLTIVEFGDLQCPACKRAQPTIEKLLTDVPNSKLIFQQFPLTTIHKWAMAAAKYGLCVAKQSNDSYWKFVNLVYEHQDEMQQLPEFQAKPRLKQYAGEAGANADQAEQCTEDPAIAAQIDASTKLGQELEVTSTPTLFVGGRKIGNVGGMQYETLKAIAEFQAQSK
jgi:protein-disulfide isomerase